MHAHLASLCLSLFECLPVSLKTTVHVSCLIPGSRCYSKGGVALRLVPGDYGGETSSPSFCS